MTESKKLWKMNSSFSLMKFDIHRRNSNDIWSFGGWLHQTISLTIPLCFEDFSTLLIVTLFILLLSNSWIFLMIQYHIDNSFNICDCLFSKMALHFLLSHMTLCNDFAAPPSNRWSLFLNPLNPGWLYDLLWLKACGRSDIVWVPRVWASRPCSLALCPLRTCPTLCKRVQSSLLEDERLHRGALKCLGCQPPDMWGRITQPQSSFQMTAAIWVCLGKTNRTAQQSPACITKLRAGKWWLFKPLSFGVVY